MSEISRRGFLGGMVAAVAGTELVVKATEDDLSNFAVDQPVHIIQPGDPEWIYSGFHWPWPIKSGDTVYSHDLKFGYGMHRKYEPLGIVLDMNWIKYDNPKIADKKYQLFPNGLPGGPDNDIFEGGTMPVATIALFGMLRAPK